MNNSAVPISFVIFENTKMVTGKLFFRMDLLNFNRTSNENLYRHEIT
jgi:hypothetical protein